MTPTLRSALSTVLKALDRDAVFGRPIRGEMAAELRAAINEADSETCELSTPSWIVNDHGELGVLVNGQAYFMYKGQPFQYKGTEDSPTRFRYVEKREFGESGPTIDPQVDAHDWMTLPGLARNISGDIEYS